MLGVHVLFLRIHALAQYGKIVTEQAGYFLNSKHEQ